MLRLKVEIVGLEWLKPLVALLTWKVEEIMATLQERFDAVNAKLDTAGAKLTEASNEILAELTKLREGGGLTPEQEQSLENIETKVSTITDTATALADTSPPLP